MRSLLDAWIAALSWLVPGERRREFRAEWRAELAGDPTARRALGALPDAWFLCRQPWSADLILQDLRYAGRLLRRDRALTVAASITLALAIGANAAVFSVLEAVMLRPIPARDPSRLVVAWQTAVNGTRLEAVFSYPDYEDWRATARTVERTALITWSTATVTGAGEAERLRAAAVTAGFFELLGVRVDGRAFEPGDEAAGAERVIIVSDGFRRKHLADRPQPLGALVTLNGSPRRVVGVLNADPLDGVFGAASDVWMPIQQRPQLQGRGNRNFTALARMAPGATPHAVQAEFAQLMDRLAREYPETNTGRGARVVTLSDQMARGSRDGVFLAAAAAGVLLLVACANVAGMMVARGLTRAREFATRAALGATRFRLVRQLALEALVLASVGAASGLALFQWSVPAIVSRLPASTPRTALVGWSPRLLLFGIAIAALAAVLAAIPAAWRVTRAAAAAGHTGDGHRARATLAALQIASASVLLVIAGLLVASVMRLQRLDAGFPVDRTLTMQLQVAGPSYRTSEAAIAFVDRLLARVEAIPAVERAAVLDPTPFSGHVNRWDTTSDAGVPVFKTDRYLATTSVFDVLGVRATRGRLLAPSDAGTNAVVVDDLFAARAFPGLDPLGRSFRLDRNEPRLVVGVVPHIKHYALDEEPRPQVYLPFASDPTDWLNLLVRTRGDAAAAIADVRQAVRDTDPNIPPYDATTLSASVRRSFVDRELASTLALLLGAITLIVAGAGLYGTMEFLVARRAREIGVRIALGAAPSSVVGMILRNAGRVVLVGAALGVVMSAMAVRAVHSLLFETSGFDPRVYGIVALLLSVVALAAAFAPARRAARIDPIAAIRSE